MTEIGYRAGTFSSFYERALDLMSEPTIDGEENPLARINHGRDDGIVQSFAAAWAVLGDILTFYQERIINEGYLRTATEEFSVRNIVALLDYVPRPALSARTVLCLTVAPAPGGASNLTIPAHTQIMSLPAAGKLPVVFETDAQLVACDGWNARTVLRTTTSAQPMLNGAATQMRLNGIVTGIRPGMIAVIDGVDPISGARINFVRSIVRVSAAANRAFTTIAWNEQLDPTRATASIIEVLRASVLRDTAKLFGSSAIAWASVPVAVKLRSGATPRGGIAVALEGDPVAKNTGLPMNQFFAAATGPDGTLWVAGDGGVFTTSATSPSWQSAWSTVRRPYVRAIATYGGRVYAGTQRGEVFGSTDNGASWYPIGASEGLVPQKIGDALTKLPQSVVRAFAFAVGPSQNDPLFVIVGTDRGVFMAADGGSTWTPQSNGLPGAQGGMSTTGILSFAVNDKVVYAATTAGLYKTNVEVSGNTPKLEWCIVKTNSAVAALTIAGTQVFIATADGVYVQTPSNWTRVLEGVGEVSVLSADGATIVAGAHDGVYRSTDSGKTWTKLTYAGERLCAAAVGDGVALLVAPFDGFLETDWPGIAVAGDTFALDGSYPTFVGTGWIALVQDEPGAAFAARVKKVVRAPQEGFGVRADVATIVLDSVVPEAMFARRTTRVAWNALSCEPYLDSEDTTNIVMGQDLTLDGMAPPLALGSRLAISGQRVGVKTIAPIGGVWRRDAGRWSAIGPEQVDARALALDVNGALCVGGGALVLRWDGTQWAEVGPGIPDSSEVMTLLCASSALFAGLRNGGTFHFDGTAWKCVDPSTEPVMSLCAHGNTIVAGTGFGVRYSTDAGASWHSPSGSLTKLAVYDLRSDGTQIVAAASSGLYWSTDGIEWRAMASQPPNVFCRAVELLPKGVMCVGTPGGGFLFDGSKWHHAIAGDVRVTRAGAQGMWWSVRAFGPYSDTTPCAIGAPNDIRAILDDKGVVYAAARAYSVFTPADGSKTIRLDQPLIDAIDGSFVDDLDHATMSTALRAALLAIGIEFSPSARIIVIAPTSSWSIEDGQTQAHASRNLLGNIDIYRDRVMELIGLPMPVAFDPGIAQYRVRDRDGFEGFLCATQTQLAIVSAMASYPVCSDIVQLDGIQISGTATAISFSPPVSNWYDPLTVSVCGNVVSASHGESLPMDDVLGSGDGSVGNQSFVLHRPPLTIFPAADGSGVARALQIRVRGNLPNEPAAAADALLRRQSPGNDRAYVVWRETDSLILEDATARAYTAREDENGVTTIEFGDGVHGRRLPAGSENVTAAYRSGSGPDGNVDAGHLTLMRSRPPGVRSIRNPIPSSGGASAETASDMSRAAPASTRTLDRIISLQDYVDFASTFPGFAKATIDALTTPDWSGLVITVAADDGDILPPDDGLMTTLATQIEGHRAPGVSVRILSYASALVKIAVKVDLEPEGDVTLASAQVKATIEALTSFDAARFGVPLRAAEIVAAVQRVDFVRDVCLQAFHPAEHSPSVVPLVPAAKARFDLLRGVLPAELVLLDERADDGLIVIFTGAGS